MEDKNLTPVTEVKPVAAAEAPAAERKLTFTEKLRANWPFIPAVFAIFVGIRMFTLTTGTQLLFTESAKGSSYRYYWLWILIGALFAVGGAIARPIIRRKILAGNSAEQSASHSAKPAAEAAPADEAKPE